MNWLRLLFYVLLLCLSVVALLFTHLGRQTQFLLGGAFVNLGYRMQDHLESYDFHQSEIEVSEVEQSAELTPSEIWEIVQHHNALASSVRELFPRTPRHPLVAIVACMDQRIDTTELTGDTRMYYYIIRTAGSILSQREQEMLELAVANGVKLILFTTHTECAAEAAVHSKEKAALYPSLVSGILEREERIAEFLKRPSIVKHIKNGDLLVKQAHIDSLTRKMKT